MNLSLFLRWLIKGKRQGKCRTTECHLRYNIKHFSYNDVWYSHANHLDRTCYPRGSSFRTKRKKINVVRAEITPINQVNEEHHKVRQANHKTCKSTSKTNSPVSQMNQVSHSQLKQLKKLNHVTQKKQVNQVNPANLVNKLNHQNLGNQVSHANQVTKSTTFNRKARLTKRTMYLE